MDKKLLILMNLFFLLFIVFIGFVFFSKPLFRLIRAKEEYLPSPKTSLMLAYPLTVKADGQSASQINVFIRSSTGIPVSNRTVVMKTNLGSIAPSTRATDSKGQANFKIISSTEGIANVEALIDGASPLDQKISILFKDQL
jgi:hypothetical protein